MSVKGVWLTNSGSDVFRSKTQLQDSIKFIADHGLNTVFPVMWNNGHTLFKSKVMERYFGPSHKVAPVFQVDGRDPLAEITDIAATEDVKVVPWFEFGFAASLGTSGGHIIEKYPGWQAKDQEGNLLNKFGLTWMDSFNPEVQDFMLKLLVEVVSNYEVAGIQGDERLPGCPFTGGYTDKIKESFNQKYGFNPPEVASVVDPDPPDTRNWNTWRDFRAQLLTAYLKSIRSRIKSINSTLIISIASYIYPWGLNHLLQDSIAWMNDGLIDWLCPQIYRNDVIPSASPYKREVNTLVNQYPMHLNKIFPGIAIEIPGEGITNDKDEILNAVEYNRRAGIGGEAFFYYEGLRSNGDAVAQALSDGPYE